MEQKITKVEKPIGYDFGDKYIRPEDPRVVRIETKIVPRIQLIRNVNMMNA